MKKAILLYTLLFTSLCSFGQNLVDTTGGSAEPAGLTMEQYNKMVNVKNKIVLVNFKADWCVVCKKQKPVLDEIKAEKKQDLVILIIDMEKNPVVAEFFEVDGLPVNIIYKNGTMLWNKMGLLGKTELDGMIKASE